MQATLTSPSPSPSPSSLHGPCHKLHHNPDRIPRHHLVITRANRTQVCESEAWLREWLDAAPPSELALPGMTSIALSDGLGVSTHENGLVRLWDLESGRRLACSRSETFRTRTHAPSCCALSSGTIAIGDAAGWVHTYHSERGFDQCLCLPLYRPSADAHEQATPDAAAIADVAFLEWSAWRPSATIPWNA